MTQLEYANYLLNLLPSDKVVESNDRIEDHFYGYLGDFNIETIDKVFDPIPNGNDYAARMKQYYSSIKIMLLKKEGNNASDHEEIINQGKLHLKNLKRYAILIKDKELIDNLNQVNDVKLGENSTLSHNEFDKVDALVYERVFDSYVNMENYSSLISILRQAYYTLASNYYISY